jgi:hypothetical protein
MTGLSAGLFALDLSKLNLSAGGGLSVVPYKEGLVVSASGYQTAYINNNWADWGVYAFFDAQYLEVDIGYYQAFSGNYKQSDFGYPLDLESTYEDIKVSYLDFGLLLKYPWKLNTKSTVTFMGGVSYWINIGSDYGYSSNLDALWDIKKKDWNQMWIDLGVGIDHYFTEKMYLRFTAGLGVPLMTEDWKNRRDGIQNFFGSVISGAKARSDAIGGKFTIAFGYKLNGKKPAEVPAQK